MGRSSGLFGAWRSCRTNQGCRKPEDFRTYLGQVCFTANFSEEIPIDSGTPALLVAFGNRYNWTNLVRAGSEFQYNVDEHSGSMIPQLWLALPRDVTVKIGYSIGIDHEPNDFARVALEVEF